MAYKKLKILILSATIFSTMIANTSANAIYTSNDAKQFNSELNYSYYDNSIYTVDTKVGNVTDIKLGSGENFINAIAGDTKQWLIDKAKIGSTTHVYIKPLADNIATNLIINTDVHSYHFIVRTSTVYNPIISFDFNNEIKLKQYQQKLQLNKTKALHNENIEIRPLNNKYTLKGSKKMDISLYPVKVYDDGVKTYIQMPENRYDLPVLYNVDDNDKKKLTLVNYRIKGKLYIADKVFAHARLQYSSKLYVDIYPNNTNRR